MISRRDAACRASDRRAQAGTTRAETGQAPSLREFRGVTISTRALAWASKEKWGACLPDRKGLTTNDQRLKPTHPARKDDVIPYLLQFAKTARAALGVGRGHRRRCPPDRRVPILRRRWRLSCRLTA